MKVGRNFKRIETKRLTLRKIRLSDTVPIKRYFTDEVTVYMTPSPVKTWREEVKVVAGFLKEWREKTSYVFAITKKENGEFLGLVGLHALDKDVPEFGIWTKREAHGNRYGMEAAAGIKFLAETMGYAEALYPVDRRNIASKKIPLSFGGVFERYEPEVTPDGKRLEIEFFRIRLRPETSAEPDKPSN